MKNLIKKLCNKETITYLIFGILTTAVNYIVYYLLYKFTGIDALAYNIIAWVAAVIFAFFTNKLFVFESKSVKANVIFRELLTFVSARLISLALEELFLALTVKVMGIHELIAKLVISVIVVIVNYFASKLFIFKKEKGDSNE